MLLNTEATEVVMSGAYAAVATPPESPRASTPAVTRVFAGSSFMGFLLTCVVRSTRPSAPSYERRLRVALSRAVSYRSFTLAGGASPGDAPEPVPPCSLLGSAHVHVGGSHEREPMIEADHVKLGRRLVQHVAAEVVIGRGLVVVADDLLVGDVALPGGYRVHGEPRRRDGLRIRPAVHVDRADAGLRRDHRRARMHDLRLAGVVEPCRCSADVDLVPVSLPLRAHEGLAGDRLVPPVVRALSAGDGRHAPEVVVLNERRGEARLRVQVHEVRGLRRHQRARGLLAVAHLWLVRGEVWRDRDDVTAARGRGDRRADERHVVRPVPEGARVPVHARLVEVRWTRDVVVPDDMAAIEGDRVLGSEMPGQRGGRLVHRLRVPGRALDREALVLVTDRVHVHVPVARMPRDVLVVDHLRDLSI